MKKSVDLQSVDLQSEGLRPAVCKPAALYQALRQALAAATDAPEFEARELLRETLALSMADILLDREIEPPADGLARLETLVRRRLAHEPLQYLLGKWEFYGREFTVGEGVLIPRPDSEILAEQVLALIRGKKAPRLLELCGGSGCLAATVALEHPGAEVTSVEKSSAAFGYLQKNCGALQSGVRCLLGDALNGEVVKGDFDGIFSNPPYLSAKDMGELAPEVRHEPVMALYGDEDGLFFYRSLTKLWKGRLRSGGFLAYEIGAGQQDAVKGILEAEGFRHIEMFRDYGGIIRVLTAKLG